MAAREGVQIRTVDKVYVALFLLAVHVLNERFVRVRTTAVGKLDVGQPELSKVNCMKRWQTLV